MKKLFSLFLVLALLCCSAFAMTVDEAITALKNPDSALSGEFDATVKITLDEPLPEFLGEDMATISTGLNDSSIGMHMVYSVSEDYKTMQAQMDMEITSPLFGDLLPEGMMDGRTLVPVRKFCNAIGISDDNIGYEDGVVTIEFEGKTITLTIDDDTAYIDDTPVTLDVPAKEIDGRTLLPLRFIGETFNMDVDYDSLTVIGGTGMVVTLNPPAEETSSQTPETELPATDTTESDRVSVAVPEDIDDATKEALTALENENFTIVYIPDNSYPEKANLMIAAGEPAIFIDTHHSLSEAITTHEGAFLAFETLSDAAGQLIEGDEDLAAAITGEDEKIYAYPIANGENIIYVYMSSTLNDPESALEFIQSVEAALAE